MPTPSSPPRTARILARILARIARGLVRGATRLAPPRWRDRIEREWDAELAAMEKAGIGGWDLARSALGAFADARATSALDSDGRITMAERWREWGGEMRLALRSLLRTPGFTATAVVSLALGMGGSAAIWTLVRRVVLEPLPYPAADRLVRMQNQVPGVGPNEVWNMSTAQYVYFGDHAKTLERVGIYRHAGGNLQTASGPLLVRTVLLSAGTMDLLGAETAVGRALTDADDRPGAPLVGLVSYGFWTRALAADPSIVGRTLTYGDEPIEIVGVLAPEVRLPDPGAAGVPDLWYALRLNRAGPFINNHVFPMIARLAPGASVAAAEAEITGLTPQLQDAFPRAYYKGFFAQTRFRTTLRPLRDDVVGSIGSELWILLAAVVLVLLIAAANVTNLFVVRMEGRRRELGIRAALGAGRGAIARYLVAESGTLAGMGGGVALAIAFWAVPALTALAPADLPRIHDVRMGADTVLAVLVLSGVVAVLLAVHPLLTHVREGSASIEGGGRGASASRERQRIRSALVVGQVALALTLAVGAGLLLQTLRALHRADLGFRPAGVLALRLSPSPQRHGSDTALWALYGTLQDRVAALPGVEAVGMTEELPVEGGFGCTVQGFDDDAVAARLKQAGLTTCAGQEPTTPGYFEAMGIPVLAGRSFTRADNDDPAQAAAVVSRSFAERFWPGEDPIGKTVIPEARDPKYRGLHHVVGVVGDVPPAAKEGEPPLGQRAIAVYYPIVEAPDLVGRWGWWPGGLTMVVRAGGDPLALVPAVRRIAAELDPEMPLSEVRPLSSVVDDAVAERAFVSLLLGIAAVVALLLAAVGLYGVVSFVVARRTREIGTRMAIGAQPSEVVRMVVGRSLRLTALGLAVGSALALAASRVLVGLLVGVSPTDPVAFAGAVAVLALVTLLASWIPARRAARIDPLEALRAD